ncbi:hypothetical protein, partial [Pantoea vagans]|uniref:hypothetical protein n=2 Tax=Pantoea TaxID=53335 RepID=UPI00195538E8
MRIVFISNLRLVWIRWPEQASDIKKEHRSALFCSGGPKATWLTQLSDNFSNNARANGTAA